MGIALELYEYGGDISRDGADLVTDSGLETAVFISLFTDRRAEEDDELPGNKKDRRGWWADAFSEIENDQYGSRLWLLAREKTLASTLERAKEYAREALAWMIEDGVASKITVEAERVRGYILGLSVEIEKPTGDMIKFTYQNIWENLTNA
jgi:phage gp46-like protein